MPPAAAPSLEVTDVEARLDALAATSGAGSTARRAAQLDALFGAATADEQRFLQRLFTGELRQGALEGVMLEAVAAAAEVPAATVRRAFFLSGRLPETARLALTGGAAALEAVAPEVGRPVRPMLASPAESLGRRARRARAPTSASSTSWTARASRCTATATRSGCGRARCAR